MRTISILLMFAFIGCDEAGGERRGRRDRRAEPSPTPITVVEYGNLYKAQCAQAKARANAMRELAESVRNGSSKTVWDVNKQFKASDQAGREQFDKAFGAEMERVLSSPNSDNLPANAADTFEKLAKEFDNVAK